MSHALFELLAELDAAKAHYTLSRTMEGAVLVSISVVGARVEAQVFADGHVWVSRFKGDESIEGGADLVRNLLIEDSDRSAQ
jgi:hypothetical protein